MSRLTDHIARILSVVLYPLFIPTYGMALFCYAYPAAVDPLPLVWAMVAIGGTLLLTCLLPVTAIWIMMKRGDVSDFQIDDPRERTVPYLYSTLGFAFWSYLLTAILHAPVYINMVAVGATVAIALVAVINRWWKISAHLTGMGGLFGGLISFCIGVGAIPSWGTFALWLGVTLALMMSRLRLHAHSPEQVTAGWLLGLLCTVLPVIIWHYAA